eukprot:scaffold8776_cov165-Amphora_coffeaeformis.AAC.2
MSSTTNLRESLGATKKAPSAYVPPHRRHAQETGEVDAGTKTAHHDQPTTPRGRGGYRQEEAPRRSYDEPRYNKSRRNHRQSGHYPSTPTFVIPNTRICCINLPSRPDKWKSVMGEAYKVGGDRFCQQIEKFDAVEGSVWRDAVRRNDTDRQDHKHRSWTNDMVQAEWDASQNAQYSHRVTPGPRTMTDGEVGCALSHVMLWKSHVDESKVPCMFILEDDCAFVAHRGGRTRFPRSFQKAMELLPPDWGIFYLGFSGRGARHYVNNDVEVSHGEGNPVDNPPIQIYQPTYGFHTHAYLITKEAASRLLEALPVTGPIDVWLADNQWFGIPTYCSIIANEGWYNESTQQYDGASLVSQKKWKLSSDVDQSAHILS